jgi:glycine/D-amino acid oxidase-like deaminating enzyme
MQILKVSQAYYPFLEKGGPPVKVSVIARALAQRGHQVVVLTADLGFGEADLHSVQAVNSPWGWQTELDGVEVLYLRGPMRYRALTWNPRVFDFCRQRLDSFRPGPHLWALRSAWAGRGLFLPSPRDPLCG